ncbi:MAG: endolytic transglycosylase MltG [Ignavibacteriaceae bacterium]
MDNIYKKIETELNSLSVDERNEILNKLRNEVDSIDRQLVHLISKRTLHSVLIGRVKRSLGLPTYSPQREKDVAQKISSYVEEPLTKEALIRIYERILDESRAIQREEANKGNIFKISGEKMKTGFRNLLSRKQFIAVIIFFIGILALLYFTFFTANYYPGEAPKRFEIRKGETLSQITDNLYTNEIIPSKINFKVAAFLYGAERKIRAARYSIPNGLNYLDLLELFISGDADFLKTVTVRNGVSIHWIAAKMRNDASVDSAAFVRAATNQKFIDSVGIRAQSLEGYLLPQKYDIFERSSAEEVTGILYKAFTEFITDSLRQRAKDIGYSLHEIITLASIVEGETNKRDEMSVIAGTYYNRLRIGMRLQADPTVQYLQPGGWKRLKYSDLNIDNPYNTYKYAGLPPGPINNPGKDAILAAFYPEKHKYLFFVADGNGGHKFSESYTQHLRLVREYREWLKSQKKP